MYLGHTQWYLGSLLRNHSQQGQEPSDMPKIDPKSAACRLNILTTLLLLPCSWNAILWFRWSCIEQTAEAREERTSQVGDTVFLPRSRWKMLVAGSSGGWWEVDIFHRKRIYVPRYGNQKWRNASQEHHGQQQLHLYIRKWTLTRMWD